MIQDEREQESGVTAMTPVSKGDPLMIAWEAYKATSDYANTRKWALRQEHVDGSLWAAFMQGFFARASQSQGWVSVPVEPTVAMSTAGHKAEQDALDRADSGDWIVHIYRAMIQAALTEAGRKG